MKEVLFICSAKDKCPKECTHKTPHKFDPCTECSKYPCPDYGDNKVRCVEYVGEWDI